MNKERIMYTFSTLSLRLFQAILIIILCLFSYLAIMTYQNYPLHKHLLAILKLPWMATTMIDFYINLGLIYLWIFFKEPTILGKLVWLALLFFGGSIATLFYVFLQTFKLAPGDSISKLLLP